MRTRHVKRFHAALFAKPMLCRAGVETIFSLGRIAAEQSEPGFRHDEMQKTDLCTDRAIAFCYYQFGWCVDFKAHGATVATTVMNNEWLLRGIHNPSR